ncbi:MAG: VWA domain-containing protein [bacterium]
MLSFKNMSFYNTTFLLLLLLIPFVLWAWWTREKLRAKFREKFAPTDLMRQFSVLEPPSRAMVRGILIVSALGFMVFGFARPQAGERVFEEKVEGIEMILALDVSRSMNAHDLYPTRLDAIKKVVYDLIDSSYSDRIGVIAFAGEATVVCPLTTDHGSVITLTDRLTTNEDIPPGTGIGNAIFLATKRFRDENAGHVVILLTDGENNKGMDPMDAVKEAKAAGVRIYTVGIGTPKGAPLPEVDRNSLIPIERNRTDAKGNAIMVGLDEALLKKIADQTGGRYFSVANQSELSTLYSRIDREGVVKFQSRRTVRRDEVAPYFLLIACLLLIMEAFYTYVVPGEMKNAVSKS